MVLFLYTVKSERDSFPRRDILFTAVATDLSRLVELFSQISKEFIVITFALHCFSRAFAAEKLPLTDHQAATLTAFITLAVSQIRSGPTLALVVKRYWFKADCH